MVVNPLWSLSYDGRTTLEFDDDYYVVDIITNTTSDSEDYYIDVVTASKYKSDYNSDPYSLAEASLEYLTKDGVSLSSGNSSALFDRLDSGDAKWVAIAYGVDSDGQLSGKYTMTEFTTEALKADNSNLWKLSYDGRIYRDGYYYDKISADQIADTAPTYVIDVTYEDWLKDNFPKDQNTIDLMAYFEYVGDLMYEDYGDELKDYLLSGNDATDFNRLKCDTWTAYAIGMDANGYPTGDYASYDFEIEKSEPSEGFNKWLGNWTIGSGGVTYEINIDSYDPNWDFLVKGYETGKNASVQASNLDFLAQYDQNTGQMLFSTQYISSNSDSEGDYDSYLYGNIMYNGSQYYVIDEGKFIAEATLNADADGADVVGCDIEVQVDDTKYKTTFVSMQYYDVYSEEKAHTYNENVPQFPLTMSKVSSATPSSTATKSASAVSRPRPKVLRVASEKAIGTKASATTFPKTRKALGATPRAGRKAVSGSEIRQASGTRAKVN